MDIRLNSCNICFLMNENKFMLEILWEKFKERERELLKLNYFF